jgi:hypothetical protein
MQNGLESTELFIVMQNRGRGTGTSSSCRTGNGDIILIDAGEEKYREQRTHRPHAERGTETGNRDIVLIDVGKGRR